MPIPIPSSKSIETNAFARLYWYLSVAWKSRSNTLATIHPEEFVSPKGIANVRYFGLRLTRVNAPEYVKQVLVDNHRKLSKGELFQRILGPSLGQGLLTIEGEVWKRHRKLMNPAFHEDSLRHISTILETRAKGAVTGLAAKVEARPGRAIDINTWTAHTTMDLVMQALFSGDLAGREEGLARDVADAISIVGQFDLADVLGAPGWVPRRSQSKRLTSTLARVQSTLFDVLQGRLNGAGPEKADLLSLLLTHKAQDETATLSADELRDEIITMFAAGHETTALALAWTLALLAQHQDIQDAIAAQAQVLLDDQSLDAMARARAANLAREAFQEALRLYPPAFSIMRQAEAPFALVRPCGETVQIAKGATISIPVTVVHRHPAHWDRPNDFVPSRFSPVASQGRHPFAFIPFGAGPRLCIGKHFAMIEASLVLMHFLARFRVSLSAEGIPDPIGRITTKPRRHIRLVLEPRK